MTSLAETQSLSLPVNFTPAGHRYRDVEAAGAHGDHAQAAAGRRMAVGTQQRFARFAEPLQVNLVAYTVAGAREVEAVFLGHALEVAVVVGVLEAHLQRVVVDVTYGEVRFYFVGAHGLELEIGHGAGRVLRQRLVDADGHRRARARLPLYQVGVEDFLGQRLPHIVTSRAARVTRPKSGPGPPSTCCLPGRAPGLY
jgi:hypothetical protein